MARNVFQPSFYRWAMSLPDSEPVALMHRLAREVYRDLGGEAIERHIGLYEAVVARWTDGPADDCGPVGDREALRCMGCIERAHARVTALREQAWLQGRAEVFYRTGARIELPVSPDDEGSGMAEKGSGSFSGGQPALSQSKGMPEKVPDPVEAREPAGLESGSGTFSVQTAAQKMSQTPSMSQTPAEHIEPPSNKQIKAGVRRLIDARVDRKIVHGLRAQARSGQLSRAQWQGRVKELLGAAA